MRSFSLAVIGPLLLGLAACSTPAEAPTAVTTAPSPSAVTSSQPVPEPTETIDLTTAVPSLEPSLEPSPSASPDLSTVEPSLEAAPTGSLEPVAEPTPEGGPWTTIGTTISDPAELAGVTEVPESFHAFMAQRIGVEDDAGCTINSVELKAVHQDGYVFGAEDSSCGASQAVWGITEQAWHYIAVFGDAMPCTDLEHNDIPTGAPGLRCMDDAGQPRDY